MRRRPGPFALQAAIASEHCRARRAEDTDWPAIVRLYDLHSQIQPSPVVSLNRAVAVAMVAGEDRALELIDALAAEGDLDNYHLLHAARADLYRRTGAKTAASQSYKRVLGVAPKKSEGRFPERGLGEVSLGRGSGLARRGGLLPRGARPPSSASGAKREPLQRLRRAMFIESRAALRHQ